MDILTSMYFCSVFEAEKQLVVVMNNVLRRAMECALVHLVVRRGMEHVEPVENNQVSFSF